MMRWSEHEDSLSEISLAFDYDLGPNIGKTSDSLNTRRYYATGKSIENIGICNIACLLTPSIHPKICTPMPQPVQNMNSRHV